jgi:hypothetical protein
MIDVSGSMGFQIQGSLTALDAAVALGLFVADKQTGPFKDMALTFSSNPKIEILKGNIVSKMNQMQRMHWDMSTDIEKAFLEVLRVAKSGNVSPEDMPQYLLIISDMEFNSCTRGTAFNTAQNLFHLAGYKLPKVIFWNMTGRIGNTPVKFDTRGTALISGYSADVLDAVVNGELETFTPYNVMVKKVSSDRYAVFDDLV